MPGQRWLRNSPGVEITVPQLVMALEGGADGLSVAAGKRVRVESGSGLADPFAFGGDSKAGSGPICVSRQQCVYFLANSGSFNLILYSSSFMASISAQLIESIGRGFLATSAKRSSPSIIF